MLIQNNSWIATVVIVLLLGSVLLGVSLGSSDALNWQTHGAMAEATRTAVADNSADALLKRNATATAIKVDATNKEIFAQATRTAVAFDAAVAPTQTAIAIANQMLRSDADNKRNSDLLSFAFLATIIVFAAVLVILMLATASRHVLSEQAKVTAIESQRLERATRLAEAEAERYQKQAEMLREQRRNAQMVALVPPELQKSENLVSSRKFSGNGNEPKNEQRKAA